MLTRRQRRFAERLAAGDNWRDAAKAAGYSADYASRLRKKPEFQAALEEQMPKADYCPEVASGDEVLRYLTGVLRGEGQSAMKAAELLGKRLGLFAEQGDELPAPVIIDDIRPESRAASGGEAKG